MKMYSIFFMTLVIFSSFLISYKVVRAQMFPNTQQIKETQLKVQLRSLITELITRYQDELRDRGYNDTDFKLTSLDPLLNSEKTTTYDYPHEPCGKLMVDYVGRGTVSIGRGPVYAMSSQVCQSVNQSMIPDDSSFRTYSCENRSYSKNSPILAHTTFAFQCINPSNSRVSY